MESGATQIFEKGFRATYGEEDDAPVNLVFEWEIWQIEQFGSLSFFKEE